jgi:GH24 family phage-related lysozyme (muramidase)
VEVVVGLFQWLKRNGEVEAVAETIRKEVIFSAISGWEDHPGGHGRYIWGYGTTADGPGRTTVQDEANAELLVAVRFAIQQFKDTFKFCPVEITKVRTRALVRLIFYMGSPQFNRQEDMIREIFREDWAKASLHLRNSDWYDHHGHRARCIVRELRDNLPCQDSKEGP